MTSASDLPSGIKVKPDKAGNYLVTHWDKGSMVQDNRVIPNTWLGFIVTKDALQMLDPYSKRRTEHANRIATVYSTAMNNLSKEFYQNIWVINHKVTVELTKNGDIQNLVKLFVMSSNACYTLKVEALLNQLAYSQSSFSTIEAVLKPDPPPKAQPDEKLHFPWKSIPLAWMQSDEERQLEKLCTESESQFTEAYYFETKMKHQIFLTWKGTVGPSDSTSLEDFSDALIESFNEVEEMLDCGSFIQQWLGEYRTSYENLNAEGLFLELQNLKGEQTEHSVDKNALREKILRAFADASRGKKFIEFSADQLEKQCAHCANMERGQQENILGLAMTELLNQRKWAEKETVDQKEFELALQEAFTSQLNAFAKNTPNQWRRLNEMQIENYRRLKIWDIESFYKRVIGDVFPLPNEKVLVTVSLVSLDEIKILSVLTDVSDRIAINLQQTNEISKTQLDGLDRKFIKKITT